MHHRAIHTVEHVSMIGCVIGFTAPTGTNPPDNALAMQIISGFTFQCSIAQNYRYAPGRSEFHPQQTGAVFLAQSLDFRQVIVVRNVNACLNRFDYERRNITAVERLFQRRQVIEWHRAAILSSGPKPSLKICSPFSDNAPMVKPR